VSRKPRYVEPSPEILEEHKRVLLTFQRIATGELTISRENFRKLVGGMLRYVEGGELHGQRIPQLSYLPMFVHHVDAALKEKNDPLVACLTLAMYLLHDAEHRIPEYAVLIRSRQSRGPASAAKRKAKGQNVGSYVEAFERHIGRRMTPRSRSDIHACAASSWDRDGKRKEYSEVTIKDFLYARARRTDK